MNHLIFNWEFLYFPEDKSAYIPAFIQFVIMLVICVLVFKWVRRLANKQAEEAKVLEARALAERDAKMENK